MHKIGIWSGKNMTNTLKLKITGQYHGEKALNSMLRS